MLRRDAGYMWNRVLRMELPGRKSRGRPKRRWFEMCLGEMLGICGIGC